MTNLAEAVFAEVETQQSAEVTQAFNLTDVTPLQETQEGLRPKWGLLAAL